LVDPDRDALALATSIAKSALGEGDVKLEVTTNEGSLDAPRIPARHRYDVVLLGQMLSEADAGESEDARVEKHTATLRHLLDAHVARDGSLVIVEPALRDRTRHLHRLRDRLVGSGARVFAPCLHDAPCPMLRREEDWCHEDLAIDLPEWLVPVARAAGLRREGLTFSYLVVRPDGETLRSRLTDPRALRVVAAPRVTKGKRELLLCGETATGTDHAAPMRLDRHHDEEKNGAMDDLVRGDLVVITPQPAAGPSRLSPDATVSVADVTRAS
jgi:ribosomal protein RSM22 (predicted rRNA methylase)